MRTALAKVMLVLSAAGGFAVAGPAPSASAATCLGSPVSVTFGTGSTAGDAYWRSGQYTTSSRCSDINIKKLSDVSYLYFRTCFVSTGTCNGWQSEPYNAWATVATGVLDGTRFYVEAYQPGLTTAPRAQLAF